MDTPVFDGAAFKVREQERDALKRALDPILAEIQRAEEATSRLAIIDDRDRRHLAQARVEILHVLANVQDRATTHTERLHRAMDAVTD